MKKTIATVLALALLFSATPAFADSTEITYQMPTSSYTIIIPAAVTLGEEVSDVTVTASDVANLYGGKISVTIASTSNISNYLALDGDADGSGTVFYDLTSASNEFLPGIGKTSAGVDWLRDWTGKELVSFTDNGESTFTIALNPNTFYHPVPNAVYTGTLTYGISVVAA